MARRSIEEGTHMKEERQVNFPELKGNHNYSLKDNQIRQGKP
jgi:hypothetical protein